MENLRENIAIVTGAGQGIGEAIAMELAACGATVFVVDINLDTAKTVVHNIIKNEGKARFLRADVSDPNDVENMVKSVIKEFERIDILVNNVGISPKNREGDRRIQQVQGSGSSRQINFLRRRVFFDRIYRKLLRDMRLLRLFRRL